MPTSKFKSYCFLNGNRHFAEAGLYRKKGCLVNI